MQRGASGVERVEGGEDGKGGWEVMARATYMGAMNMTPELLHCGPMSGSGDM